jgi:hypothetical protein
MSHPDDLEFLEGLAAAVPPPSALRDRILAGARGVAFSFVMHDEGIWLQADDGSSEVKALLADSRDRIATRLVRCLEGGPLPAPALAGRRALFVLEGRIACDGDGAVLLPGGFADESPPMEWRGDGGTLLLEYSDQGSGVSARERLAREQVPGIAAIPDGAVHPLAGGMAGPRTIFILSMRPDAVLAEHEHHGIEELFVLSGNCEVEGRRMEAGDYHRATDHSSHHATRTFSEGCDLLVVLRDAERMAAA